MDLSSIHYPNMLRNIKKFGSAIGHKDLMLDVGSGKASYKGHLSYTHYISIDIDFHARPSIIGDACHLPVRKEVIDTITLIEVLEHIENVDKALSELNYVLKKDGYLILSAPLIFGIHAEEDFFRWTEKGIRWYLEKSGFCAIKVEKNGGIFGAIGETLRHVPDQILGHSSKRVNLANYGVMFLTYLFLIPFAKLCIALDVLDIKRNFTTGYTILCKKELHSGMELKLV